MKTRFAITHINRDGMRQLSTPNQGRCFTDTRAESEKALSAFNQNNSPDALAQVYGPQAAGTFQVWPVECYDNGDAVGIYFKDPDAPFDKEHAETFAKLERPA